MLFVGSMGVMEFRSAAQIREGYADMYTTALLTNWKVWPIAQVSIVTLVAAIHLIYFLS